MKKTFVTFFFIFISLAIAGCVLFCALKENSRNHKIENEINLMKQQASRIKSENRDLQEKNQYFSTPEFQEKIAKEKLDLQKQDENVVIVKPSPSLAVLGESSQKSTATNSTDVSDIPNFKKWWNLFFAYKN